MSAPLHVQDDDGDVIRVAARSDEAGASAVEYGLLLAGVAALIIVTVFLFGGAVQGLFGDTCDSINSGAAPHISMSTCS
jgi:pilus assembly protein Flp/PilA